MGVNCKNRCLVASTQTRILPGGISRAGDSWHECGFAASSGWFDQGQLGVEPWDAWPTSLDAHQWARGWMVICEPMRSPCRALMQSLGHSYFCPKPSSLINLFVFWRALSAHNRSRHGLWATPGARERPQGATCHHTDLSEHDKALAA